MTESSIRESKFDIKVKEIPLSENEYTEVKEEEFPSITSTPGFEQKIILFLKQALRFLGEKFDAIVSWVADNSNVDRNRDGYSPWKIAVSVVGVAVVVEVIASGAISVLKFLLFYVILSPATWLLGILSVILIYLFHFDPSPFLSESWRIHGH